ncbi:MAG: hypothetical protein ABIO72_04540 [Patescibacteria group bacterium]
MFHLEDVLQLKDDEDVQLIVRRHPVTLFVGLGISFIGIVLPFFFLFPLFAWGIAGISLFGILIIGGILLAMRTILLWDSDVLVVTTLRLVDVDQKGLFSRFVKEAPLTAVQDIAWSRKGLIDTMFHVGTLDVTVTGAANMTITRVAHPEKINELVNDLRHHTSPKRTDLPPDRRERIKKLVAQLEGLSDEGLDRAERAIRGEGREEAVAGFLQHKIGGDESQPS